VTQKLKGFQLQGDFAPGAWPGALHTVAHTYKNNRPITIQTCLSAEAGV